MRIFHGASTNIDKPTIIKSDKSDINWLGPAMYFFSTFDEAANWVRNKEGGRVYEYEVDTTKPGFKVLDFRNPASKELLRFRNNAYNIAGSYDIIITPACYSDVYAELVFSYIDSNEELDENALNYVVDCIKSNKVLGNDGDWLVGETFKVDDYLEIVITNQKVLDTLKLISQIRLN